jgi:hypothetical protein
LATPQPRVRTTQALPLQHRIQNVPESQLAHLGAHGGQHARDRPAQLPDQLAAGVAGVQHAACHQHRQQDAITLGEDVDPQRPVGRAVGLGGGSGPGCGGGLCCRQAQR